MLKLFLRSTLFALAVCTLAACGGDEAPQQTLSQKKTALAQPFQFQRSLAIKPGLTYDILTWGRGIDSATALLILRSDSTHKQFRSTSGELKGKPLDAWDMDLDTDGNPELALQVQLANGISDLYIYEFDAAGNSQSIRFPSLSDKAMKGYKGKDRIYIKDGNLRRDFLYQDPDSKEKAIKRTLEYTLRNNALSINEIEEEPKK